MKLEMQLRLAGRGALPRLARGHAEAAGVCQFGIFHARRTSGHAMSLSVSPLVSAPVSLCLAAPLPPPASTAALPLRIRSTLFFPCKLPSTHMPTCQCGMSGIPLFMEAVRLRQPRSQSTIHLGSCCPGLPRGHSCWRGDRPVLRGEEAAAGGPRHHDKDSKAHPGFAHGVSTNHREGRHTKSTEPAYVQEGRVCTHTRHAHGWFVWLYAYARVVNSLPLAV